MQGKGTGNFGTGNFGTGNFGTGNQEAEEEGSPSCLLPLASCLLPLASCLLPLASYLQRHNLHFNFSSDFWVKFDVSFVEAGFVDFGESDAVTIDLLVGGGFDGGG
ncbi:MAG: hypothetical protein HLUCCO16_12230 [Phormidium sp. OSCR]|nr:MAG: hypothetical protein HLUCCO16_12230 [Phormidium sp. OSCR]